VKRDLKDWSITKGLALDKRVEASNSCARTLIFGSFYFIAFLLVFSFYLPLFIFCGLMFYCLFLFFGLVFLLPFVSPLLFHPCFVSVFRLMWVSFLAYPNLLGTKRLGCCCITVMNV
jgi:hypothetical protein